MSILFFGDSITEGSNCDITFTDFLPPEWDIYNFAVSGTTIGEYSIYPVDGNSLLSMIDKHKEDIRHADHIFIEYGGNDVSAIMCGFVNMETVVISFVKALDWIKQLNPDVTATFLCFGSEEIVKDNAERMCEYLEKDYFSQFNFSFPSAVYAEKYLKIVNDIYKVCDIMYMFDTVNADYLSSDNIHPNEKGHKRIALNILKQYM